MTREDAALGPEHQVEMPFSALLGLAASENHVVFVGDTHDQSIIKLSMMSAESVQSMANSGVRHLILEGSSSNQPVIDAYLADDSPDAVLNLVLSANRVHNPNLTIEEAQAIIDSPEFQQNHLPFIEAIKEHNVQIHYVDDKSNLDELREEYADVYPIVDQLMYDSGLSDDERDTLISSLSDEQQARVNQYFEDFHAARWESDHMVADRAAELALDGGVVVFYGSAHISKHHDMNEMTQQALPDGMTVAVIGTQANGNQMSDVFYEHTPDYIYDFDTGRAGAIIDIAITYQASEQSGINADFAFTNLPPTTRDEILQCRDNLIQHGSLDECTMEDVGIQNVGASVATNEMSR